MRNRKRVLINVIFKRTLNSVVDLLLLLSKQLDQKNLVRFRAKLRATIDDLKKVDEEIGDCINSDILARNGMDPLIQGKAPERLEVSGRLRGI